MDLSKKAIKVVLSPGPGKLYFHDSAAAIAAAGASVEFVVGWLPGKGQRVLVDLIGRLLGEKQLAARMAARAVVGEGLRVVSNAWMEFAGRGILILSKGGFIAEDSAVALSFRLAGFAARGYLRGSDIFHVRSGAGQGGAIGTARTNGLKVLTDHSIAHPTYMKEILSEEYRLAHLPYNMDPDSKLWKLVLRDCHEADLLLVNSDFVRETFVANGYPPGRIRVAYLGVQDRYLGLKTRYAIQGHISLLFTGNFELRKGVRLLLQAVRALRAGGLDVRLHLIGNLSSGKVWLRDSDAEFFRHSPYVAPEELLPMLASADMFVFPTLAEGSSRSAMEAAAAGVPVITTTQCGLPLVDGDSVVYVPANDAEALTRAIERLAGNEGLRESLGRRASRLIKDNYSWLDYGKTVLKVYGEMLGATSAPR
jgi:glycosyltransferase involved in cell wall biosynthesis